MYIEVKTIKFLDHKEASQNKNYPESGFYLTEISEKNTDLRLVDKSTALNVCICPKSVFDGLQYLAVNPDHHKVLEVTEPFEVVPLNGYASESFILDFTKILLSQKK